MSTTTPLVLVCCCVGRAGSAWAGPAAHATARAAVVRAIGSLMIPEDAGTSGVFHLVAPAGPRRPPEGGRRGSGRMSIRSGRGGRHLRLVLEPGQPAQPLRQ